MSYLVILLKHNYYIPIRAWRFLLCFSSNFFGKSLWELEKKTPKNINTVPHRGNQKAKTLCDGNTGNGNTFFSSHQQSVWLCNTDCWCDEKKVLAMNTQQEPTLKLCDRVIIHISDKLSHFHKLHRLAVQRKKAENVQLSSAAFSSQLALSHFRPVSAYSPALRKNVRKRMS